MMTDFDQAKRIIKASISCLDVAEKIGFKHDGKGRSSCPFHGGDNPTSFVMYPIDHRHDGGFYCHSCHVAGDVIGFVMHMKGLTFAQAINWFRDTFNVRLPEINNISAKDIRKYDRELELRRELYMMSDLVTDLYCRVMEDGKTDLVPQCNGVYERMEQMLQTFKRV